MLQVVMGGPLRATDAGWMCALVHRAFVRSGAGDGVCDVSRIRHPDLDTVHVLALLQLTAGRVGGRIEFRAASRRLLDLIALVGLEDVMLRRK